MNTDKIYANKIALEYSSLKSRKAKALKRLDAWIKRPSRITSIVIGILSILLFAVGFIIHFYLLSFLTTICFAVNPSIYLTILNKRKKDNATDILLLAQEVIDEND